MGAGPAGIGAAVQAEQNGLSLLLLEKSRVGGRIRLAYKVDNLISPTPLTGVEIVKIFFAMLRRRQISVKIEEVISIRRIRHIYRVRTVRGIYHSKTVIVATGLRPRLPKIRGIKKAIEYNMVFFDWQSLKKNVNSPVIIIGGGEVGFDSACSLKRSGFESIIITRSRSPDVNPYLFNEVKRLSIPIVKGVRYKSISVKDNSVELTYQKDGILSLLSGRSILVSIGGVPNTDLIGSALGEKGIFICGDAHKFNFYQASIAFGDGVSAAMKVTKFLKG